MELGVNRLIQELKAIKQEVDGPFTSGGQQWLVLPSYTIVGGKFADQVVRLAVAVPADFPQTPPGGLYVSPRIVAPEEMGRRAVHDRPETSELGGDWQYWSRPIPPGTWTPANPARRLVAHWNMVMFDVTA
jgi:hypothetical protein